MSDRGNAVRRIDERRRPVHEVCAGPDPRRVPASGARARRKGDAAAVAGYIADMTTQLESMARAAGLDLLAYFLAMARAEANAARGGAGEDGDQRPQI
jgi:hypothetical protein